MKQKLTIFIVLLFFVYFTQAQNNQSSLIASWKVQSYQIFDNENATVPLKKISTELETLIQQKAIFTFTKEHTFSKPDNSSASATYTIKDNQIIIYNDRKEIEEQFIYTIVDNKLILKYKLTDSNECIEITAIKI